MLDVLVSDRQCELVDRILLKEIVSVQTLSESLNQTMQIHCISFLSMQKWAKQIHPQAYLDYLETQWLKTSVYCSGMRKHYFFKFSIAI